MAPVPAAATPTSCAPFLKLSAYCSIGPSHQPATKVNKNSRAIPITLLRVALTPNIRPIITASITSGPMIGDWARKEKLVLIPTIAPITVGIMVKPSIP